MSEEPFFLYEKDVKQKIAFVTMNRPEKRNAAPAGGKAERELLPLIRDWELDDNVKVVIIRGAGDHFCAGYEAGEFGGVKMTNQPARPMKRQPQRRQLIDQLGCLNDRRDVMRRLLYSLKPTIAQVHGFCIEWGNMLQSLCDMTIASEDAQFGNLGQTFGISGVSAIRPYIQLIGQKRTREMMMTGRLIPGKEAEQWGLINVAVPRENLEEQVMKTAKRITILPIDGIVTGKAYTQMVYEEMGLGNTFIEVGFGHALGAYRLAHEPDEFHFFRSVREKGVGAAIREREDLYKGL